VKFQVYKNGKRLDSYDLYGAYLLGTDGIAIRRSQIAFEDGCIVCRKPNMETSALVLLWNVEGFGKILLSTTCLPEREKPYILNVELARARLMQIITKREDWSFFSSIGELGDSSKPAHELFTKSIQNIGDAVLASTLADESLKNSLVFSEQLAVKQAGLLFDLRVSNKSFGRGCFGVKVDPLLMKNPAYAAKVFDLFGMVTIPINWAKAEPQPGKYNYDDIDACLNAIGKRKIGICAGPILQFSECHIPSWLHGESNFEKVREAAYQFVMNTVGRYTSVIRLWRVISCLNNCNHFSFSFEQVLEMTRSVSMAVKAANERALKIIEICNPWGEYYAESSGTIPPLVYLDMILQSGINFDALGLQMRFGDNKSGMHVRDMMQISAALDQYAPLVKPVYITEVEVPSQYPDSKTYPESVGVWHHTWEQNIQAKWLELFTKIILSKPFIDGFTYSQLVDSNNSVIPNSGLLDQQLNPKKSYQIIHKLRDVIFAQP
jgi:GH35 family endo-1,4-beta-xylanase